MPYRHAHWYLLAIFPLIGVAFWQNYLSKLAQSPMSFHAHGLTATLWLLLLIAQSWSMHSNRRDLHRSLGSLSLVLFPLFLAGGTAIFFGMADRYVAPTSPFYEIYPPRLAWLDFVGVGSFAYFYYMALRYRRKVHLHSGYMLATVTPLLPPIIGRLMPVIPLFRPTGPEEFWRLGMGFQTANVAIAAMCFAIGLRRGRNGRPFHVAGALILLSALLYQSIGTAGWWEQMYRNFAGIPWPPFAVAAGIAGVAIGYAGWVAGRRTSLPPSGALPA